MSRFGDFATNDLVQRVNALAIGVDGVHEMHAAEGSVIVYPNCHKKCHSHYSRSPVYEVLIKIALKLEGFLNFF